MKRRNVNILTSVGFALLLCAPAPAPAATAPALNSLSPLGVVSSTFTNANTPPQTIVNGDVCYTTGPTTPPVTVTGSSGPCPAGAGGDQGSALANLNGQPCTILGTGAVSLNAVTIGANPTGTLPPGCYSSGGAMNVVAGTTVTLSGNGVYVFRSAGAITTGANSQISLTGGACADNVFWAPIEEVTLGATSTFVGNILDAAGISIGHNTILTGRALAFGGTVTTDAVTITVPPICAPPPNPVPPTISKAFGPNPIGVGGVSTLTITLNNPNASTATLTAAFVDTLPAGLLVAPTPNASTNCTGNGDVQANAGGTTVTLPATRSIPPGSCWVRVDVTAALAGNYVNTVDIGALQTSNGSNAAPATATLVVTEGVPVPTLPVWALLAVMALLSLAGFAAMRRRTV